MPIASIEARRLRVRGVVQGVGFRPFVHRLATSHALAGRVWNDGDGVVVEVEGQADRLDRFATALVREAPPLAAVARLTSERAVPTGATGFAIVASPEAPGSALIPPDVATCEACLAELARLIAAR